MSKAVLITGSNGLLGQKLVHLLKDNSEVNLIASSKGKNRISDKKGYKYLSLDITSKDEIESLFREVNPDIVINTAAMTNVDACETNKEDCWKINVTAVEFLCDACKQFDSKLLHLSTDFVFDGENGPYKESDQPNPLSYYGNSKWESEKVVENSGLNDWAIARTIIVFGIAEEMSRTNIVLWAKSALEKGDPLTIVDDQFRSPTLAEDLALGCWQLADSNCNGIYHLSGKDLFSIIDLVYAVADYFNLDKSVISPIKSITLNQAAKRPPKTGFILDKAINDFGYNPHSFSESLEILTKQL